MPCLLSLEVCMKLMLASVFVCWTLVLGAFICIFTSGVDARIITELVISALWSAGNRIILFFSFYQIWDKSLVYQMSWWIIKTLVELCLLKLNAEWHSVDLGWLTAYIALTLKEILEIWTPLLINSYLYDYWYIKVNMLTCICSTIVCWVILFLVRIRWSW